MDEEKVNPLLQEERNRVTFPVEIMTNFIDGSREETQERRRVEGLVANDPDFQHPPIEFMSREEQYELGVKKAVLCVHKMREHGIAGLYWTYSFTRAAQPHETSPFGLHDVMFIPSIMSQGTPEQQEVWLSKAINYQIIGTYAQTEMGHGTFLRGIETTATFLPQSQEFELHTPTTTSLKWWPGGLGKTSNCAIVAAQLFTKGVHRGTHMFLLQIRDFDSHEPMPGVVLGDVGPKLGFATVDNGFMQLNRVRIPREQMLMRNAQVLPDGTFVVEVSRGASKSSYGTMVLVRSVLVSDLGTTLGEAATIATRYSAIRCQGPSQTGSSEMKLLDYPSQQFKLLTQIATAYAIRVSGDRLREHFFAMDTEMDHGINQTVAELHALSAGLKALSSWRSANGIEVCRQSCGGHGYSLASGLSKMWTQVTAACTYEGDNTVMMLQTARYLLKCMQVSRSDQSLASSVSYLTHLSTPSSLLSQPLDIPQLVNAYRQRAIKKIQEADSQYQAECALGKLCDEVRQNMSIRLLAIAFVHTEFHVCKTFAERISDSADEGIRDVLEDLCRFYCLQGILDKSGDFFATGCLSSASDLSACQLALESLLHRLRPNMVSLVDAFDIHDRRLGSVLGRRDGNVYENLLKWAQQSPLNKHQVHDSYYKYIRPLMKREAEIPAAKL